LRVVGRYVRRMAFPRAWMDVELEGDAEDDIEMPRECRGEEDEEEGEHEENGEEEREEPDASSQTLMNPNEDFPDLPSLC
jgi:hypothetical protein